jgi:hypothetical protein
MTGCANLRNMKNALRVVFTLIVAAPLFAQLTQLPVGQLPVASKCKL